VLVGWFLTVAGAFAQTNSVGLKPSPTSQSGRAPLALTFEYALVRAMSSNEGLKVMQEKVHESQGQVAVAKSDFLPAVDLNFLYTPAQRFPLIRIPPGIFGPDEQTFQ